MDGFEWVGTRLAISERAEALATTYGGGPPVDLEAIAQTVGILDVVIADIDSAARLVAGPIEGFWAALLRQHDPWVRRRFSLAHEIGHLALGIVGDERRYGGEVAARGAVDQNELACDYFAACLLMPRGMVSKTVARATSAAELARVFNVSLPAMRRRLDELGFHALARTSKSPARPSR